MNGKTFTINAPLTGTFYRRPSPDDPPYVEEGEEIGPGKVLCIIESMKVFNEVRTEKKGIVRRILIEDEDPVMINQPMFEIEILKNV
jgi:acetyl-CoA carboxylase biotin carboxyl carrier protein